MTGTTRAHETLTGPPLTVRGLFTGAFLIGPLLALALVVATPAAIAETRTVGPGEAYTRIQDAIDASDNADIVIVKQGTERAYVETLTIPRTITLTADVEPDSFITIRMPAMEADSSTVVHVTAGPWNDQVVEITGFILRGGKGWAASAGDERYGGAIMVDSNAAARLSNCMLDSSQADWGGGLAVRAGGSVTLHATVVDTNQATFGGGGIYVAGSATLDSVTVRRNAVRDATGLTGSGGGIYVVSDSAVVMRGIEVFANDAQSGGGIALDGRGAHQLTNDSVVSTNLATAEGGGIHITGGTAVDTVTIESTTISLNSILEGGTGRAIGSGGGIYVGGDHAVRLRYLDLRFNRCEDGGGIAIAGAGARGLSRSVIAENSASGDGGGIYLAADTDAGTTLQFLTIDANSAQSGGGIHVASTAAIALQNCIITNHATGGGMVCGNAVLDFNDRWNNWPRDFGSCPLADGSISADPRYTGGEPFSYELAFNSPCIDAADPTITDFPVGGGVRADIGAFEYGVGPVFTTIELDPNDPQQDGLYKTNDQIAILVSGVSPDSSLAVELTADFGNVDELFNAGGVAVSQRDATPPGFSFRITYTIGDAGGQEGEAGENRPIDITATTAIGGSATATLLVDIDDVAPAAPRLHSLPAEVSERTLTVTGTASGADSVHVLIGDSEEPIAWVATTAGGSFAATVDLVERHNTITATALDVSGNESDPSAAENVAFVPDFFIEYAKRFSPGGAFTIGLPSVSSEVEITIVNLAGQIIRRLSRTGARLHEIVWDGDNDRGNRVNAGPYIVRFEVTDTASDRTQVEHHALILTKGGAGQ